MQNLKLTNSSIKERIQKSYIEELKMKSESRASQAIQASSDLVENTKIIMSIESS